MKKPMKIDPESVLSKAQFETPVSVTYGVSGGHFWTTTGVLEIVETKDGQLIFRKSDDTFTKINTGWLSYDVLND